MRRAIALDYDGVFEHRGETERNKSSHAGGDAGCIMLKTPLDTVQNNWGSRIFIGDSNSNFSRLPPPMTIRGVRFAEISDAARDDETARI